MHAHARQQHGFGAQQALKLRQLVVRAFKIAPIRPHAHFGAAVFLGAFTDFGQRLQYIAAGKHDAVDFAFTLNGNFQTGRQRVGNRHTHAVQTAGKGIGAVAAFFVEFAARVQLGKHQFHHRHLLQRVQAHGDTAAIVGHAHGAVGVDGNVDMVGKAAQGFVGGVVNHFLDDVGGAVGAGVHARPLFYRL